MSKLKLPANISNVAEAKEYLTMLQNTGYAYHCEDSAKDIVWNPKQAPTETQAEAMNKLMAEIYAIPNFDPCEYLQDLQTFFLNTDTSGHGTASEQNRLHLKECALGMLRIDPAVYPEDKELYEEYMDYLNNADIGQTYEFNDFTLTRL